MKQRMSDRLPLRGAVALVIAIASFLLLAPAQAQATAGLNVVKNDDAGATFHAVQLLGFDLDGDLGELARQHPELLTKDAGFRMGEPRTAVADNQGIARFRDMEPGVYQVSHVGEASPFLVRLKAGEITQARAKEQHVYVAKKALQDTSGPGQDADFQITAAVPAPDAHGKIQRFVLSDPLDPRLDFQAIERPTLRYLDKTVELREGPDFFVTEAGNRVTVDFTEQGLSTLAEYRRDYPNTTVQLVIATRVRPDAATDTPIRNIAELSTDGTDGKSSETSEEAAVAMGERSESLRDRLPMTGANILFLVLAGITLIILALVLLARRRKDEEQ